LISIAGNGYGNKNSTALKPDLAANSNRSRKGTSLNNMVKLAANFGIENLEEGWNKERMLTKM
jgi:hypothetical protein